MATEETESSENGEGGKKKGGMLIWIIVMVVSIAGGAAAPIVISGMGSGSDEKNNGKIAELEPEKEIEFIDFKEVTVNLNEARHSRYLRLNIALQVGKSQKSKVETQLAAKIPILLNWIQLHLGEKSTEELNGRYGKGLVRREILDKFNDVLFDDGLERIQDILIIDWNVQ